MESQNRQAEAWWSAFFRGPWEHLQLPGYPEERTRAEVEFMISALELQPEARVLDIPCGEGRHTIELAKRGFRVTGFEFNPNAIAAAVKRAAEAGVEPRFVTGDMRELDASEEYDATVCFFTSFGYFNDEENLDFARRVARALRPGGRFLLELHIAETVYPIFREREWSWVSQEPPLRVLEERRFDLDSGRMESTWTFIGEGETASRWTSLRVYSYRELQALLREAGFSRLQAFETGKMEPFRLGSSRLSLVATR
jgi:SAM-dependent methyltransferase